MENKTNILIIDDDLIYRKLSSSILQERFNVFTAETPSAGFEVLRKNDIKYVVCDYHLPEMDGLQVLEKIKQNYPEIEVIMISNTDDMNIVINALRNGAVDYFKKPFTPADIWMSIERTRKIAKINSDFNQEKNKNKILKKQVASEVGYEIIGSSKQISEIKKQMEMVAQTPDTSVLILGESGTGKELVARGIHNFSARKDEFFGAVNMSAIPETLFESEFFGHRKGSFTGALADKAGWFETTDKGTLFLDEIGEMSLSTQVKLLRVLEDRTYTKVGAHSNQKFDIRIIAATNKKVDELSSGKEFRTDLFHRIGTFIINVPPLRERSEDIPELADYFLHHLSQKLGKNITKIEDETLQKLQKYSFPGNIRELRNIMERAVILCQDNELTTEHFQISFTDTAETENALKNTFNLEDIEKQVIIKALKTAKNNKSEAAKLLNIEWNALHRRIRKYDLEIW